jgi:hypothetical protein
MVYLPSEELTDVCLVTFLAQPGLAVTGPLSSQQQIQRLLGLIAPIEL